MGYRYYGSFGLDYDVLPHRIVIGDRLTNLWNLSCHPVGLGLLLRYLGGYDGPRVRRYFEGLAAVRQQRHEPHFYYCHPEFRIGRYPEVYLEFSEDDQAVEWAPAIGDAVALDPERSRREAQPEIERLARCEKHQALAFRMLKTYRFLRTAREVLRKLGRAARLRLDAAPWQRA